MQGCQYNGASCYSGSPLPAQQKHHGKRKIIGFGQAHMTMNATLPRFEFRIFGTCLGTASGHVPPPACPIVAGGEKPAGARLQRSDHGITHQ
jgi:hypothetical protein